MGASLEFEQYYSCNTARHFDLFCVCVFVVCLFVRLFVCFLEEEVFRYENMQSASLCMNHQ